MDPITRKIDSYIEYYSKCKTLIHQTLTPVKNTSFIHLVEIMITQNVYIKDALAKFKSQFHALDLTNPDFGNEQLLRERTVLLNHQFKIRLQFFDYNQIKLTDDPPMDWGLSDLQKRAILYNLEGGNPADYGLPV